MSPTMTGLEASFALCGFAAVFLIVAGILADDGKGWRTCRWWVFAAGVFVAPAVLRLFVLAVLS